MTKQPKMTLAPVSIEAAKACGIAIAKAVVTFEKAKLTLMDKLFDAIKPLSSEMNAKQWDKQVAPYIKAGLATSKLSDKVQSSYASMCKTAGLAILSKLASPNAGESLREFYDRASTAIVGAKLADGSALWEGKVGRTKTAKGASAPRNVSGVSAVQSAGDVSDSEGGFNRSPKLAAALMLAGSESRAQRLLIVLETYAEAFDRWTSTILTDADKADAAKLALKVDEATPSPAPVGTKADASGSPDTAMAAALIKAAKPRKAA